jgi:hypothetical protein
MFVPTSNRDVLDLIMSIGDLDAFIRVTGFTRESIEEAVAPLLGNKNSAEQIMLYSLIYQQLDPDASAQGLHTFTAASVTGFATLLEYLDTSEDIGGNDADNFGFNIFVVNQMAQNKNLRNIHEAVMSKSSLYIMEYGKSPEYVKELAVRMVFATMLAPTVSTAISLGTAAATFGLDLIFSAAQTIYTWISGAEPDGSSAKSALATQALKAMF